MIAWLIPKVKRSIHLKGLYCSENYITPKYIKKFVTNFDSSKPIGGSEELWA